ncbi:MAG TPA: hypothetical protein VKH41_13500 [Myxococcota bacterium]|nr:hypothetical protein [Myxococcota bacterium]
MLLLALAAPLAAAADEQSGSDSESGTLQPTYEPRPPAQKPTYSTDYIFAITRAVTDSTLVPAARVPLYFLSIPTDLVFLPIELIAGFFPGE